MSEEIKIISAIELENWKGKFKSCKTIGEGQDVGTDFCGKFNVNYRFAAAVLARGMTIEKAIESYPESFESYIEREK